MRRSIAQAGVDPADTLPMLYGAIRRNWLLVSIVAVVAAWLATTRLTRRINARQRARRRGRERDIRLRRAMEMLEFAEGAGGFGVFEWDVVTGQVRGSPRFFALLDLTNPQAHCTRDDWLATIHPADFEHVVEQLNVALRTTGTFHADYRSLRQDGASLWLAGRGRVLSNAQGLPVRAIGTLTDVTERKRLEESLRQARGESLHPARAVAAP